MLPSRLSSVFRTAAQGLAVQREKISVASRNIANAQTSSPQGSPNIYRPQTVQTSAPVQDTFKNVLLESVSSLKTTNSNHISAPGETTHSVKSEQVGNLGPGLEVVEQDKFRYEYDPNHPDADENGMVRYPDVDLIREMTQMVSANRLYEANLSSIEAEKQIIKRAFEI